MAATSTAMSCDRLLTQPSLQMSLRAKCETVQKRNMMVSALSSAFMMFTINATLPGSEVSCVNRLPVSMKKGAPGG